MGWKKEFLFVLVLSVLSSFSCKRRNDLSINSSMDYLPLKVGNYWDFEQALRDSIKEVHEFDGKTYFEMINNYGTSSFYRKEKNKIYIKYLSINSNEEMIFDLSAKENDTWKYGAGEVILSSRNATILIGDTLIDRCLCFYFYNANLMDYGRQIWLAPNIGFVQQNCQECFGSSFETMKLIKARINNREIIPD